MKKIFTAFLLFVAITDLTLAGGPVIFAPSKDNTLYEDPSGQTSNGAGIFLFAGRTIQPGLRRGLIAFDLTSIPPTATITSVSLSMTLTRTNAEAPVDTTLSKVLHNWGEGASDAGDPGGGGTQAETNDATWLHTFYDTSFWTTIGGDFSSTASASTPVINVGATYIWSSPGMVADVQSWVVNPATNFGWVIRGDEVNDGTALRFGSRENPNVPPRLSVTYSGPTPTPSPSPTPTPTPITPTPTPTPGTPTATPTPGTPTPSPTVSPTPGTPTPSPTPTPQGTPHTPTPTPSAAPSPAQALNISTRMQVQTGSNVLIAGFIVSGTTSDNVVVRGIGPSLGAVGVSGALADPTLDLINSTGASVRSNDNWQDDSSQAMQLVNLGLAPTDTHESGIVETLSPAAYTAILAGKDQTTGVGLVEVYDISRSATAQLANISTRGFVLTGTDVMIGGFILGGNSDTHIVLRGIGPSLAAAGLSPVLADPTLELRDSNGTLLVMNDNWQEDPASASQLTFLGLAPSDPMESGIYTTLPPGSFTAILAGKSSGTGIGLVEIYNVH